MTRGVAALILTLALLLGHAKHVGAQSPEVLRNRVNQGTVSVISGGVNGTYIRIASDLAAVLDKEGRLRILPIIGKGPAQNIIDLLYLRGIDVGIVQSDVLSFSRKENLHHNIAQRIRYVTKLYNEEVHILAGRDVGQLSDLTGKKVNVDVAGSGTAMTASLLFDALGLKVETTHFDQALALQKVKDGEIAAMVYVVDKPADLFRKIEAGSNLHFVPIPLRADLLQNYLPSSLTDVDYPRLIPNGQSADTVAVGAVIAVYNWDPSNERYKRVAAFVDAFFDGFGEFLKAPQHPKWQEVNLAAELPGWTRFQPAQDWLDRRSTTAGAGYDITLRNSFEEFLAFVNESAGGNRHSTTTQIREAMFARFLEWRKRQREQSPAEFVNILTGGTSGVYYPLGNALAAIYGKAHRDAKVTVQATQGSVQNLNLLQVGRGEAAFALADSAGLAWKGEAYAGFSSKLDKLRTIAAIYPNYIQIVAAKDSGIKTLADLKGKRVSVGAPRSGTEVNARRVFQAAGLSYDMMSVQYLPFDESVELMKQRELDATLQSAGLGVASISDLAWSVPISIVPIPPKIIAMIGPPYFSKPIPAGTYQGQDREVMTAAIDNLLMTHEGVPADVIYTMTKGMFENMAELTAAHAAAEGISLQHAPRSSPVPLHPGAARYYKEKGLLK